MDEILEKVVIEISQNHDKIIDDWCKAYLAQLYEEGVDIKPGCFTLNEQVPTIQKAELVKRYWFEPGIPDYPKISCWTKLEDQLPPQDGTPFLGYDPSIEEEGKIYVLIYVPERKYPPGEFEALSRKACYKEASGEGYFTWKPTHWMPLPEKPK